MALKQLLHCRHVSRHMLVTPLSSVMGIGPHPHAHEVKSINVISSPRWSVRSRVLAILSLSDKTLLLRYVFGLACRNFRRLAFLSCRSILSMSGKLNFLDMVSNTILTVTKINKMSTFYIHFFYYM